MASPKNVLGNPLQPCSLDPLTGWYRDGSCRTDEMDYGTHVACVKVTEPFLKFSFERGNDLITPNPTHRFPGLKPGDRWCLCARRWLEAHFAGMAPPIYLESTHERMLEFIDLETLQRYAMDNVTSPGVMPKDN
jgi:Uncharacterized protein conserved in bacteria